MGGRIEFKLRAPSSSSVSHLIIRAPPVRAVSGRDPVRRIEAILAVRSEAGGPSDRGEEEGTRRGKKGQPYLTFLLEVGGKRGI